MAVRSGIGEREGWMCDGNAMGSDGRGMMERVGMGVFKGCERKKWKYNE